ncbi:uncharacterized protein LOC113363599 [Ctenocephalides felis]|uniref:uncharacterized protein LOC113363599 n=1 Tax=Ctenocephalides felis TaxID=7515 RepID=UPI000E6E372E|nr:uncharacterized protein LOC113363599 [Ctenocephalides felis]
MALRYLKCFDRITSLKTAYGNFINIRNISHSTAINKFNSTPIKAKYDPCITQHLSAKNDLTINVGNFIIPLPAIDIPTIKEVIDTTVHKSPLIDICKNSNDSFELPNNTVSDSKGIQAARLIVIRRRKMKKHKLRKLRKKMKFEWAKVRQRRELRKEKAFQAMLLTQIREAEKFSAEQYVSEKIRQATETPIPRFWKGKRLPQFIIKQKLGIK